MKHSLVCISVYGKCMYVIKYSVINYFLLPNIYTVEAGKTDPWLSQIPVLIGHIFWTRIYMYIACALKSF